MGQKVRPTGFRTGIMRPWRSTWYASKNDYSELLLEDARIRAFIQKYLTNKKDRKEQRPAIADIRIERTRERVIIVVTSSRVGAIINGPITDGDESVPCGCCPAVESGCGSSACGDVGLIRGRPAVRSACGISKFGEDGPLSQPEITAPLF